MKHKVKYQLNDEDGIKRTITRLAFEIIEDNRGSSQLALIGIRTRGVPLAERLAKIIADIDKNPEIPIGVLDITLYRDDFMTAFTMPEVKGSEIPFNVQGKTIILVDDVLYTGRTVRSAIDAIMDYGRPEKIRLAILIDRGHREMPIQGDFVGRKVITSPGEEVVVRLKETDGVDEVVVVEKCINKEENIT